MAPRETPRLANRAVSNPALAPAELESFIQLALSKDPTLTPAHADALRKLHDGPRHAVTGERIFNGVPIGTFPGDTRAHFYPFNWVFGESFDPSAFNFGSDMDAYTAALAPLLNAENPDLSAFKNRGGKLVMFSGAADSLVPWHATASYYTRAIQHLGGLEKTRAFFAYYLVPGRGHGNAPFSITTDLLGLLVNWREKNTAPPALQARKADKGRAEIEITVPLWTPPDDFPSLVEPVSPRFLPEAGE
jgi:feruloyl esterase